MGRRTRKAQCSTLYAGDFNKRSFVKASIDPVFTSSLDPEDLEVMGTDRDENTIDDSSTSTFREP
jgi:hypothetical protein